MNNLHKAYKNIYGGMISSNKTTNKSISGGNVANAMIMSANLSKFNMPTKNLNHGVIKQPYKSDSKCKKNEHCVNNDC